MTLGGSNIPNFVFLGLKVSSVLRGGGQNTTPVQQAFKVVSN